MHLKPTNYTYLPTNYTIARVWPWTLLRTSSQNISLLNPHQINTSSNSNNNNSCNNSSCNSNNSSSISNNKCATVTTAVAATSVGSLDQHNNVLRFETARKEFQREKEYNSLHKAELK